MIEKIKFYLLIFGTTMVFIPKLFGFQASTNALFDSKQNTNNQTHTQLKIDHYNNLALGYVNHNPDSAFIYAERALEGATQLNYKDGQATSNYCLGLILSDHGAFNEAFIRFNKALSLYQAIEKHLGTARTHNALGHSFYFSRQLDQSLEQHLKALSICQEQNLPKEEAITLGHIGHFYEKQGDYDKALNFQNKALAIYEHLKDFNGLSEINGNLGSIYEDLENYDQAMYYFKRALENNLKTKNEQLKIVHLNNLGDVYRKTGQYQAGQEYSEQALQLALRLEQKYQQRSAYKDLSEAHAIQGNYIAAYEALEKSGELYEALYDQESAQQLAKTQMLYNLNEKQKAIELLERENRIAKITRNAILGGFIMLTLLAIITIRNQRLKIKKDKELLKTQENLIKIEKQNALLREQQLTSELEAKSTQLTSHALHIIQKNKMLKELKTKLGHLSEHHKILEKPFHHLINKINFSFAFDQDWEDFQNTFQEVHADFYHSLNKRFPDLTAAEIRLCALLKLNLDSKDIATILGISQDSLRVTRYRLRKKLNLQRGANLTAFIMSV